jgi:hypothetical protein
VSLQRGNAEEIVDKAHSRSLPVVAHWATLNDLNDVVAAGIDRLENLDSRDPLDDWPEGRLLAAIERELALTPTLAVTEAAADELRTHQLGSFASRPRIR